MRANPAKHALDKFNLKKDFKQNKWKFKLWKYFCIHYYTNWHIVIPKRMVSSFWAKNGLKKFRFLSFREISFTKMKILFCCFFTFVYFCNNFVDYKGLTKKENRLSAVVFWKRYLGLQPSKNCSKLTSKMFYAKTTLLWPTYFWWQAIFILGILWWLTKNSKIQTLP